MKNFNILCSEVSGHVCLIFIPIKFEDFQILEKILKECFTDIANSVEVYSEPNQTSKMEFFVKIGNAFNLFAVFVKKFHFVI